MTSRDSWVKAFRSDRVAIAVAWLLVSVPFLVPWAMGRFPFEGFRGEMLMQWLPYRFFMRESYGAGTLPLWTSYICCGMPFWGYSHTMSAYPPMMASLFLPHLAGVVSFFLFHALVAVGGTYRLLERLGFGRGWRFWGALLMVAGGCGMWPTAREFYLTPAATSWLPVIVYFSLRLLDRGRARDQLGLVMALALQFLVGDVENAVYNLFGAAVILAVLRPGLGQVLRRASLARLATGLFLAVALAAAMWAPLSEYMPHHVRSRGVTFEVFAELGANAGTAQKLSLDPFFLLGAAFFPASFLKWSTLFLAVGFAVKKRRAGPWIALATALLLLLFAARKFGPLEPVLYHFLFSGMFMKRAQAFGPAVFLLQLLSLYGALALFTDPTGRAWRLGLAATGLIGATVMAGLYPTPLLFLPVAAYLGLAAIFLRAGAQPGEKAGLAAFAVLIGLTVVSDHLFSTESQAADYMRSPRFEAAAARMRPGYRYLGASFVTPRSRDLYTQQGMVERRPEVFGWNRVPPRRFMDLIGLIAPDYIGYDAAGRLANWSFVFNHADGALARSARRPLFDLLGVRYLLIGNVPIFDLSPYYLVWTLDKEDAIKLRDQDRWKDVLLTRGEVEFNWRSRPEQTLEFAVGWADAPAELGPISIQLRGGGLSVEELAVEPPRAGGAFQTPRYSFPLAPTPEAETAIKFAVDPDPAAKLAGLRLLSPRVLDPTKPFQAIDQNDKFDLFENPDALPLSFLAPRAELFPDDRAVLTRMGEAGRAELAGAALLVADPATRAALAAAGVEAEAPVPGPLAAATPGSVTETWPYPGRIEFQVSSPNPAVLMTTQNRLPGWRLFVDGAERPTLRADHAFIAAPLAPGDHHLQLTYRPPGFRIGLFFSLASLASLAAAAFRSRKLKNPSS